MAKPDPSSVFEKSKHPLVVLAATTLLGSILIPYVNTKLVEQNRRGELRASHAIEALRSSSDTDRRINLLMTEFANFAKDEAAADRAARAALRNRVYALYAEFNRDGWWWYWSLLQEAEILGFADRAEVSAIRAACEDYASNLIETTQALDPMWALLIRAETRANRDEVSSVLKSSSVRLASLQQQRQEIVGRMIAPLIERD